MESLLVSVSKVENSLMLVESLIQNIYLFELPDGNLIINMRFDHSKDHDSTLIGGLTATIQEFAGTDEALIHKSISMEELNLIFVSHKKFLIVFAVDPNYPDSQFTEAIDAFIESFNSCLENQEYGTTIDGAALSVQTINNLISEEIHIEIQLGSKVTIYPFKLRELADKTAESLLGLDKKDKSTDLYDDTEDQEQVKAEYEPIKSGKDALNQLLSKFLSTFNDVHEITLIRTSMQGEFEQYTKTKLEKPVSEDIHNSVMEMIDIVSHILEQDLVDRTIEIEENGKIFFQKVTDYSFMYIVINESANIEDLEPIIERIGSSIENLFPDDMVV